MTPPRSRSPAIIVGLNTVRFLAAAVVACGHGALPDIKEFVSGSAGRALNGILHLPFNGIAAVMVFFIVSGLCIHLPYVNKPVPLAVFYTRRYVRIGVPLLCAIAIMKLAGGLVNVRGEEVLWSVYVELTYYTLYPLLVGVAARLGMARLVLLTFLVSTGMTVTHLQYPSIQSFGLLAWLWGLPIWLLGCLLAEQIAAGRLVGKPSGIWLWRIAGVSIGVCAMLLQFHSPVRVPYPLTMLVFAVFAFFWLAKEICGFTLRAPWPLFEMMGEAGYSLYLVHNMVLGAFQDYFPWTPPYLFLLQWLAIGCATYFFYKLIEHPAHRTAKALAAAIGRLRRPGTVASGP